MTMNCSALITVATSEDLVRVLTKPVFLNSSPPPKNLSSLLVSFIANILEEGVSFRAGV